MTGVCESHHVVQFGLSPVASGRVQRDVANDDVEDVCFWCGVGDLILDNNLVKTPCIHSCIVEVMSGHECLG